MTAEQIIEIPLAQLHDSPFQPRIDYTGIDELAANISAEGRIHQPLVVRLRGAAGDGFEIVFGHRRRRGAERAGLPTAPCVLRTMSDAEVRSAQMAENVQREAMKALEEAAGYKAMIEADGLTANEVATAIGKSLSHVYGRLRLLDLCHDVRKALLAGEVKAEVALLIARVGDAKMQQHALKAIRNVGAEMGDGGGRSFRRIRELLNEKFTLQLDKALFDPEDEMLLPAVGHCMRCPKRTENAPEFEDVATEKTEAELDAEEAALERKIDACKDEAEIERLEGQRALGWRGPQVPHAGKMVCTDPDCFEAKKKAHLSRQAKALEADGRTVIAGNKARQLVDAHGQIKGELIPVEQVKAELAKAAKGKPVPQPVLIQNPRDGRVVEAYRPEDLQAAGVKVKAPKAKSKDTWQDQQRKYEEQQRRHREAASAEFAARRRVLDVVRTAARARAREAFELQAVCAAMLERLDHHAMSLMCELHGDTTVAGLQKSLAGMTPDECSLMLLDCAIARHVSGDQYSAREQPAALLALAKHYGVDVDAARAEPRTPADLASPPVTAARGKKSAAAGAAKKAQAPAAKKPKAKKAAAGAAREVKDKAGSAGQADWVSGGA